MKVCAWKAVKNLRVHNNSGPQLARRRDPQSALSDKPGNSQPLIVFQHAELAYENKQCGSSSVL